MSGGEVKYVCAACSKPILVFADQFEVVDKLRPEDRLHHACSVERTGVIPDVWYCPRCDRPATLVVDSKRVESSYCTPNIEWVAQLQCVPCQCISNGYGRTGSHAAKMLYYEIRRKLASSARGGGFVKEDDEEE